MNRRDLEKDIRAVSAVRGGWKQGKSHYREKEFRKRRQDQRRQKAGTGERQNEGKNPFPAIEM